MPVQQQQNRRRFQAAAAPEKPKAKREALSLRMIYAPVIAYVVLFQRTASSSGIGADTFRQEIRGMLDRAASEALQAGYSPEKVDHVRFSIVAFADEAVLNSDWPSRSEWMERPLQLEEFETNIAGDQFFDRLEGIAEIDPEIAEIDFLILSLGFKGRYVGSDNELLNARRRLFKRFPANAVMSVAQLTPEAYEENIHGLAEADNKWAKWKWLALGLVAGVVVIIYVVLQLNLGSVVSGYKDALAAITR
jgi:type VI secretion system protein ImpK